MEGRGFQDQEEKWGGAAPPQPPGEGGSSPRFILGRACAATVESGFIRKQNRTRVFGRDGRMYRFRIAERPSVQVQDSGTPEGYRRQEHLRKRERRRTMEGSPENSVFRSAAPNEAFAPPDHRVRGVKIKIWGSTRSG